MINSKRILTFSYLLCTKNYKTQTCMVVRPLGTRKNINKDKSHWFICLIGGHISKNCANKCFKRQLLLKPGSGPWKGRTLKSMDPEKHKIKKHAWKHQGLCFSSFMYHKKTKSTFLLIKYSVPTVSTEGRHLFRIKNLNFRSSSLCKIYWKISVMQSFI